MKKSLSDPPDPDRTRLSPSQADGDLFRLSRTSSRRPTAGSSSESRRRPASLSESNLYVYEQQQQQQQEQEEEEEKKQHTPVTSTFANDGGTSTQRAPVDAGGSNTHGIAAKSPPSISRNNTSNTSNTANTGSSSFSGSATAAVSPASASAAPLQEAWPGSVLEGAGDKEKAGLPRGPADTTDTINTNNNNNDDNPRGIEIGQTEETEAKTTKRHKLAALAVSFLATTKMILLHSWLNVFLVFVPAGIMVGAIPGLPPAVVFSLNAIAIIPLAGLLGFATEIVAHRMGDSIGALLNITFGNAVELIIFIALVKNEIRIVQASLLGSILANLLLILGMSFLLGGLRFREQIYNSTVTQMSACLLSLSVISLVLPTAFHASFKDPVKADTESLKISRGTSVVLLLVYGIYLLFQLKSHAYMYESTPQHIIDEESTPGPAAAWLDSSSSDDSSSSSSDSDTSGHSRDTMRKRMRRVIRGGRRRKSSVASLDTAESLFAGTTRTPSFSTATPGNDDATPLEEASTRPSIFSRCTTSDLNDEAIEEDDTVSRRHQKRRNKRSLRRYRRNRRKLSHTNDHDNTAMNDIIPETSESATQTTPGGPNSKATTVLLAEPANLVGRNYAVYNFGETRRVDFAITNHNPNVPEIMDQYETPTDAAADLASARRAFNLRAMSTLRPVAKSLAPTVFTQPPGAPPTDVSPAGPIPRIRYGIHRTNSLPGCLNNQYQFRPPGAMLPSQIPAGGFRLRPANMGNSNSNGNGVGNNGTGNSIGNSSDDGEKEPVILSRKAAIIMLLVTTGLVAACAEFMVASINGLVKTGSVGEVFIGLIILPIVGNAAEHVTAVMVAMKNKMDLAIGVAVGSSIQIALFMTPLVVILGWIIDRDMTLYFTLFETVCLFVSAFIVNFLVLDGRSNYLEGALLCSTYVIISLVAFFYPAPEDASSWG